MLELQDERYLRDLCSGFFQNTLLLSEIVHHSMAFAGGKGLGLCFTYLLH